MATRVGGSDKLRVRFPAPAPIKTLFVFVCLFVCLCFSAGAVAVSDGTLYDSDDFPIYYDNNGGFNNLIYYSSPTSSDTVTTASSVTTLISASGSGSGSFSASSPNLTYFDQFYPRFRFMHIRWGNPRSNAAVGTYDLVSNIYVYLASPTASVGTYRSMTGTITDSHYSVSFGSTGGTSASYCIPYAYTAVEDSGFVRYDVYLAFYYDRYPIGLSWQNNRPSGVSSGSQWTPTTGVLFEFSDSKILPPDSSGSGSTDLTPVINDIATLSAQMTASFNAVNANIDAAETSITQSISDQTDSINDTISSSADTVVNGVNDHFDEWDNDVGQAYSSADDSYIAANDDAVASMHQFEDDQIQAADDALADVGLDSYEVPEDLTTSFVEISTIFRLLFNSFSFLSPLIIFSCTFGIVFVLIGRKPRGD